MTIKPIEYPSKLTPIFEKPKRLKIMVGGRGGAKSVSIAGVLAARAGNGARICCGREFQNSIDDSVHSLIKNRIQSLGLPGFDVQANKILHGSGGEIIYKGLSRNPESIRSVAGLHVLWVEEGNTLSDETLKIMMPSVRSIEKSDKQPEIWVTMNRGSSNDPISKRYLKRAEKDLARCGYYEDDFMMVVQINYFDNPWFPPELEAERKDDEKNLPKALYRHIWLGDYSDEVENSIIMPEWFDVAIDAHKKLGWKPTGIKVVSHDPSDMGADDKGLVYRHGSLILDAQSIDYGDVNEGLDQATDYAIQNKANRFIWDGDGLGGSLNRQVNDNLSGTGIGHKMFKGSMSPDHPTQIYDSNHESNSGIKNEDYFFNRRAQYYWLLRDRFYKTYRAIKNGEYFSPDDMISLSSEIKDLDILRSEVCRIPKKPNGNGKIQILSKVEMVKRKIESPNISDSLMMSFFVNSVATSSSNTVAPRPKRVYRR